LVIEVDGGQHFLPEQQSLDSARTDFLEQQGLRVLRFTNREVFLETEEVLQQIWLHLHGPADEKDGTPSPRGRGQVRGPIHDNLASRGRPLPNPLLQGEGTDLLHRTPAIGTGRKL
jgi:hypothetical protein